MKKYNELLISNYTNYFSIPFTTKFAVCKDLQKELNDRLGDKNPYKRLKKLRSNFDINDDIEDMTHYYRAITYRERPVDTVMLGFDLIGYAITMNDDCKFVIGPTSKHHSQGNAIEKYVEGKVYDTFRDIVNDKVLADFFEKYDRKTIMKYWSNYDGVDFEWEDIETLTIDELQDQVLENMPLIPHGHIGFSYFFHHPDQEEFDHPEDAVLSGDYHF